MTYSLNTLNADRTAQPPVGVSRFAQEIALVLGAAALVFWLISLLTHSLADPAWSTTGASTRSPATTCRLADIVVGSDVAMRRNLPTPALSGQVQAVDDRLSPSQPPVPWEPPRVKLCGAHHTHVVRSRRIVMQM